MGKNCADRRCISEWDSFIATQAYSTLCKSKTMKEVKSGERQKHWQMRRMILSDISLPLNHITEGLEYKHTYAVRSLAVTALSSFSPLFHLPLYSVSLASLGLSLLFSPLSCLSHCHPLIQCFPGDLTLWCYCVRKMILISAPSAEVSCKLPFPRGASAKLTGTNSLWHTIAWVLRDEDLVFAFQKEVIFSRLAMWNDIIIRRNFDLTKTPKLFCKIALSLWVKLLFCRGAGCKEKGVWLRGWSHCGE